MRKSISTRYFTTTTILLLSSIIFLGCTFFLFAMRYFKSENDTKLMGIVDKMVTVLESGKIDTGSVMLALSLDALNTVSDTVVFITDTYGNTVLCSEGVDCPHFSQQIPAKVLNETFSKGYTLEVSTMQGLYTGRYYTAGKPYVDAKGTVEGFVFASSNASNLTNYMADVFSTFFIAAGIMLLLSSVLSIVLTSRMITPLRRITEAAKSFGKGDFTARVPVEGDDEVADLAVTFNNMATSLERIEASRRSFMGDVAHELRTPMTTIKGFVDGMLDDTIPPESYKHYLGIVSQEVGRLTRLTRNMLDITKLEAGEYVPAPTNYDIWETLTNVMFAAEKRFEANHIGIEGFAPYKTLVYADQDMIYQVVYNIIDNAIKFTNEGGKISLNVFSKGGMVTVGIRNTGEGINADALPYIFDRFYKVDKSRGLHAEGSGLGMHISKVLVNRNGGDLRAESVEGEYAEFILTLPVGEEEKLPIRSGNSKLQKRG
ncbi:MAG: HAMP domain-containing sensor histidine kinase [Oscillospiraceae bacterium]|nr:HAMP domain-containing sensor histidine kinase [Oscillospiraceae bacterium]